MTIPRPSNSARLLRKEPCPRNRLAHLLRRNRPCAIDSNSSKDRPLPDKSKRPSHRIRNSLRRFHSFRARNPQTTLPTQITRTTQTARPSRTTRITQTLSCPAFHSRPNPILQLHRPPTPPSPSSAPTSPTRRPGTNPLPWTHVSNPTRPSIHWSTNRGLGEPRLSS